MNVFGRGGRGGALSSISSFPGPLGDLDPNCELYGSRIDDRSGHNFLTPRGYNSTDMDEPERRKGSFYTVMWFSPFGNATTLIGPPT